MLIKVTQEDIDSGLPCVGSLCPIANAIEREVNLFTSVGDDRIYIGDDSVETPVVCRDFIWRFDNWENVEPFEFEIDYERSV